MNTIRLDYNSSKVALGNEISFLGYIERLKKSGLVSADKLEPAVARRSTRNPSTSEADAVNDLAADLIHLGLITPWQQRVLMTDAGANFFFGRYKLLDQIGGGGMGKVYLAEHILMKRRVALKVLTQKPEEGSNRLDRFLVESRAVANLDHRHIVRLHHLDHENGVPYMVMEYVEGEDMKRRVARLGPLPYVEAADYIRQTALGLECVHQAGLVHRDVKPANIMIDLEGAVKIMDLGLALMSRPDEASLTDDHCILGTVDYIAPEQVKDSHRVDTRADIYGLGGTFYYLLTGHPPFRSGELMERLHRHLHSPPPSVLLERPDCPRELVDLVERMLAKSPDDRPQTAREVYRALETWLMGTGEANQRPVNVSTADSSHDINVFPDDGSSNVLNSITHAKPLQASQFGRSVWALPSNDAQKQEALITLAAGVAHRFNNMLQCILGEAGLASMELEVGSPARDNLARLESAAQRATELSQQLQLYANKAPSDQRTLDFAEVITEVVQFVQSSLPPSIKLDFEPPLELPRIRGDARQLRRLIMILLINAREAIGDKPGRIAVTVGVDGSTDHHSSLDLKASQSSHSIFFRIEDNGVGVRPEDQTRIFDPFYSTKSPERGMGLAVAQGITSKHRGTIRLSSRWGTGSTVEVTLPTVVIEANTTASCSHTSKSTSRILVVDDEDQIRELMNKTLTRFGFEVVGARNGRDALTLFQAAPNDVDLVVLDMTMPDMSGEKVFRELQLIKPDVKVLLASGSNDPDVMDRMYAAGLAGYLPKPFQPRELIDLVRSLLNAAPVSSAPTSSNSLHASRLMEANRFD